MDAAWFHRVYGPDPDEPAAGPRPGRFCVELVGGPWTGCCWTSLGWDPQEFVDHTMLMSEQGASGRSST
ncbi:hypothetical protein PL81_10885, partial [Streptomyces sp. RSD-27]